AKFFRLAKLCESAGYGFDKMLQWKKQTGNEVLFETSIDKTKFTFMIDTETTQKTSENYTEKLHRKSENYTENCGENNQKTVEKNIETVEKNLKTVEKTTRKQPENNQKTTRRNKGINYRID
ncbi:MAG: hypothetical protein LBN27_02630, partial [Prevotellaceae bacterium]|nr:hypothetical protein [Prevotellaceae bacterium]